MFESWSETLYDETFSDMFDALVAEYKNGEITVKAFKRICCCSARFIFNIMSKNISC